MSTYALSVLRSRAKKRADMENSSFVSDAEWNEYINASWGRLYDLLVSRYVDYYVKRGISFTSTLGSIPLPNDYYKLMGVDVQSPAGQWVALSPYSFADRNTYRNQTYTSVDQCRYRLINSGQAATVELLPTPTANVTGELHYVPQLTALAVDGDTVDVPTGWEEWIVVDAARKALVKEESHETAQALQSELAGLVSQLGTTAAHQDISTPPEVQDVTHNKDWVR